MTTKKRITLLLLCFFANAFIFSQGKQMPPWEEGMLDIHHINTGRGDSAFFVFPDRTTLLVDAGDMSEMHPRTLSPRNAVQKPNTSKSAPEWIVNYIHQFSPNKESEKLDYVLLTHYHDDHFGEMDKTRKFHSKGNYALTGITEVGSLLSIGTILDRGSSFPINLKEKTVQERLSKDDTYKMIETLLEYWKFIGYQKKVVGLIHETLIAGKINQIKLKNEPDIYLNFKVRNIAVNGSIWTGDKNNVFNLFNEGEYPGENPLSACLKISYGKFDYFTGGDISGIDAYGESNINSVESILAPVVGPVDVATLNHHGNRDSQNTFYVRTIRPRVWVQQNWSSDHPGEEVFKRIISKRLYPGERDIFSTVMLQANKDVIGGKLKQYKSQNGHIVVRVKNGGSSYEVYILNDENKERNVLAKYGPYESR